MSYIGTTEIGKMFLGDVEIDKAYLGSDLVFSGVPVPQQYTITVYPSSYDTTNSSFGGFVSGYGADNAYASATSTSQCRALLRTGANAVSTVYWKFDLSSIPAGAEITSISLQAKVLISNTTYCPTAYLCVCEGTTEKGNHSSVTSNSASTKTLDVGSGWTRDKLQNLSLLYYSKRGTSNTTKQCYQGFYGSTLIVNYSV